MRYLLATIVPLFIFYLLWSHDVDPERDLSKKDKIANAVTRQFGYKAKEGYDLRLCGIGGGATEDKIHTLSAHFYLYRPVLKDEARQLIVTVVEEFLKEINEDEELRPYLQDIPFTTKNLDVIIFFRNVDRYEIFDPYMGVVSCTRGKINYSTYNPEDQFKYIRDDYETYEEAVAILQVQNKS